MKISVDIGALCGKERFGNYIFTENLIKAISLYDQKNEYYLYSFCDKPQWLKTTKNISYLKLRPRFFWMNFRVTAEEVFRKKEIFLALSQAAPLFTSSKIISFCHGLSYYFYPQYYPDSYQKLKSQLERMVKKSTYIIVSCQKVKNELTTIFRKIEAKIKVLPFGIPFDMNNKLKVNPPTDGKKAKFNNKFFLFVGMNHPIKNIDFIKKAFARFKKDENYKDYKLYIITKNISRKKLKQLYQQATALLTASFYESFNLPVLEALSCGCPVIGLPSAIIPEFYSYVHLAKNLEEFVGEMKTVTRGQIKPIDKKRLKEQFSWERYVHELNTLYTDHN